MTLFQFELWPINEVGVWTDAKGRKTLNWFALTHGWYTMNCGGTRLMQFNPALIAQTPQWNWKSNCFDYQVARLYDDILQLVPHVIQKIPSRVVDMIRTRDAEHKLKNCVLPYKDTPTELWDLSILATSWWFPNRQLSSGHIVGQPHITMWRENDTVFIRWTNDSSPEPEAGISWNSVADGEYSVPVSEFLSELKSFHDRLLTQMSERIQPACDYWSPRDVQIDRSALLQEQLCRKQDFELLMLELEDWPGDDESDYWEEIYDAIAEMNRTLGQ